MYVRCLPSLLHLFYPQSDLKMHSIQVSDNKFAYRICELEEHHYQQEHRHFNLEKVRGRKERQCYRSTSRQIPQTARSPALPPFCQYCYYRCTKNHHHHHPTRTGVNQTSTLRLIKQRRLCAQSQLTNVRLISDTRNEDTSYHSFLELLKVNLDAVCNQGNSCTSVIRGGTNVNYGVVLNGLHFCAVVKNDCLARNFHTDTSNKSG